MVLSAGCGGGTPARVDAGPDTSRLDAGQLEVDAGQPEVDAGTPEVDAGMSLLECESTVDCGLRTGRYCELGGGACGADGEGGGRGRKALQFYRAARFQFEQ
jgi:hypothetical protein